MQHVRDESVLQCVAVCCSLFRRLPILQYRAQMFQFGPFPILFATWRNVCCSVLPCVAVCCRALQGFALCCSVLRPERRHYNSVLSQSSSSSSLTGSAVSGSQSWSSTARVCDMTRSYTWHDSFSHVTCLVAVMVRHCMCVWHDSFIRACVWHDSFICVMWITQKRDMTQSHTWHALSQSWSNTTCVCNMTRSYVWHLKLLKDMPHHSRFAALHVCMPWLTHMYDMPHPYECQYSFSHVTCLVTVMRHIHGHRLPMCGIYSFYIICI